MKTAIMKTIETAFNSLMTERQRQRELTRDILHRDLAIALHVGCWQKVWWR